MTELRAFHNDLAVKQFYIARVQRHMDADELIRGMGWDGWRGCAVGCSLENYDHSRYPIELGIPEWLARVEDTLFEGMSHKKAMTWPRDFLAGIEPGADLERVKGPFLIHVLKSALSYVDPAQYPDVVAAVHGSIALWQRDDVGSAEWQAAADAAARAAYAAARAARAAYAASYAAYAAARAARAAYAAYAAYAADYAAYAAADAAARDDFSTTLLGMLREVEGV